MDLLNQPPLITVITVVFNDVEFIEQTILSVVSQSYKNIEYIIVDGGSSDGTLDVLKKHESKISYYISESDFGIYDAMNKGIKLAKGEWINFMNSGDQFNNEEVLSMIYSSTIPKDVKFIYSDFYVDGGLGVGRKHFTADYAKGIILHQSVIYKKELHEYYGYYLVTKKIIVSDYLFFNAVPLNMIFKTAIAISINNDQGVSQGEWCYYQKKCVDYIFGRISIFSLVAAFGYYQIKHFSKGLSKIKDSSRQGAASKRLIPERE
jgi:glycosyltransferase involved in cell wall biosynthesis